MSLPECCMPRPLRGYFSFHSHTVVTAAAFCTKADSRRRTPCARRVLNFICGAASQPLSSSTSNLKMRHAPLPACLQRCVVAPHQRIRVQNARCQHTQL